MKGGVPLLSPTSVVGNWISGLSVTKLVWIHHLGGIMISYPKSLEDSTTRVPRPSDHTYPGKRVGRGYEGKVTRQ